MLAVTLGALVATGLAGPAMAALPGTVLIDGALTSKGGGPVADGSYDLKFSLYATELGGSAAWSEASKIPVKGGAFRHALGSVKALGPAAAGLKEQWLGVTVGKEAELPRQRVHASFFARHAGTAHGLTCTGCVKNASLALDGDLDLKKANLVAAKITATGDIVAGGTVTAKQFVGDGSKLKGITIPSGECKTKGEVVKGINPDGTLKCVKAMDPSNLPADGLNEISDNLITNQFVDVYASKTVPKDIIDNAPTGMTDVIDVPDVGIAQKVTVAVEVTGHTDVSKLRILLFDGSFGAPPPKITTGGLNKNPQFLLYDGGAKGPKVSGQWPAPTKMLKGDAGKWIGKNPKGKWHLVVIDTAYKDNKKDGKLTKWSVTVQTLSNKKVKFDSTAVFAKGFRFPVAKATAPKCDANNVGFAYVDPKGGALWICNGVDYTPIFITKVGGKNNPAQSCKDILTKHPDSKTGIYWLQPGNEATPFQVYCDMITDGGGWTLVGKVRGDTHNGDGGILDGGDATRWRDRKYLGNITNLTFENALGPSYHSVGFTDFMLQGLNNKSKILAWRHGQSFANLWGVFKNKTTYHAKSLLVGDFRSLDWRSGCGKGSGPNGTGPQFYGFNVRSDGSSTSALFNGYSSGWCAALAGYGRSNTSSNYTGGGLGANCQGRTHQMGRHYWGYGDGCTSAGWSGQKDLDSFNGHAFFVR